MNQNNEYITINLKDIFFYVLRRWKPVFVIALVFALLLGSIQAFREYRIGIKAEDTQSYWIEYQNYQDELALYKDRVVTVQSKIDALQSYMDHSVLMNTDYRNVYVAKATYYIDSGYKIMPEVDYQDPDKTGTVTWNYSNFLQDYSIYEDIGLKMGIEAKYLMELVSIHMPSESMLMLAVYHSDKAIAQMIMTALQEKLNSVQTHLNATVAEHTLTQMTNTCGLYVDDSLKANQQATRDELLSYQDELILLKQELHDLKEVGSPDTPNALAAFIKWCIVGCLASGALAAAFLFFKVVFVNCVLVPDDLVSRYNIPVLGSVMHEGKKRDFISLWLRRLEGRLEKNSEENIQFLAVNLQNHLGDVRKILVCGDASAEENGLLSAPLSKYLPDVHFASAGSLLREVSALKKLAECDAVLLTVIGDASCNKDIAKELNLIRECGKSAVGFVFMD